MNTALDKIKKIIDDNQCQDDNFTHFVLQGGAGSGKTESLKEIITYISNKYPEKKIVCITHTNVAVDEIKARVGNKYEISTIHSFLNSLIRNYKKNIWEIIHNIFCIENITQEDHSIYKKVYEKYSSKLFSVKKENCDKPIGKREYEKSQTTHNFQLNKKINALNDLIKAIISSKDFRNIKYNETRFDSFEELSFSHDSLLLLSYLLCCKYKLLTKIISDKYDFIFIDEYQDTNEYVIKLFLDLLPQNRQTTIGLFGDSMQAIYDDGIGDITSYINQNKITKIDKEDNYRCSKEIIDFINTIRLDGLTQKIAFKINENMLSRKGTSKVYYKIVGKKPTLFSSLDDKERYLDSLNAFINEVKSKNSLENLKILMLTNKSISTEIKFSNLYNTFSDRYSEVKEEIEKELSRIQISDIVELCRCYQIRKFNPIFLYLKKNRFEMQSLKDKQKISQHFEYLLSSDIGLKEVLDYCFEHKLMKKTERFINYIDKINNFLSEYNNSSDYIKLEKLYYLEGNTVAKLKKNHNLEIEEEEFNDFIKAFKKKNYYLKLFSNEIKFQEALNYYQYLNEETPYITMHKTKGSGIENVMVVLDEYFWNKYNFRCIYDTDSNIDKRIKNTNLFYVSSSRAIKNLIIIRLIEDEQEEELLEQYFQKSLIYRLPDILTRYNLFSEERKHELVCWAKNRTPTYENINLSNNIKITNLNRCLSSLVTMIESNPKHPTIPYWYTELEDIKSKLKE